VGADVPVVIQIGKWRRQFVMPNVPACANTPISDTNLTRLPRNQSEGNIPRFAIRHRGSGRPGMPALRVGVDEGRVHQRHRRRARMVTVPGLPGLADRLPATAPSAGAEARRVSCGPPASMMRYDIVLMACEGDSGQSEGRTAAQYQAVRGYGDGGGRVLASHYHTNWVRSEDGQPNAGYPNGGEVLLR